MKNTIIRTIALATSVIACNTILDNKRAAPAPSDPPEPHENAEPAPPKETINPPKEVRSTENACSDGQRQCHGTCVLDNDPRYGCGDPSCSPCDLANATAACAGGRCAVAACADGHGDCNADPSDGCEADLSLATSCGACETVCPSSAPVCAAAGTSFACSTGCSPSTPDLCGTECVSLKTNVDHCGQCNTKCPTVAHADVTCVDGQCTLACKPEYHACGGKCVASTDPLACGPACVTCPVPTNAAASCENDVCSFRCLDGFGDCNQDPSDGCEASFATDPRHCGACNNACPGGSTCKESVCSASEGG